MAKARARASWGSTRAGEVARCLGLAINLAKTARESAAEAVEGEDGEGISSGGGRGLPAPVEESVSDQDSWYDVVYKCVARDVVQNSV
ncbi:hypothetical protein E2562_006058 [Oryza meyeriana var. granulata]|uniref:Uncharacterized protein n=1 Tax=Oryza meyeriana var. granulata TaxID=110450 RepID=A0A6G1EVH6_9ORYZ|nr:hypothetical protein E2562_006058 [Oryza meyeriana var. granulata]